MIDQSKKLLIYQSYAPSERNMGKISSKEQIDQGLSEVSTKISEIDGIPSLEQFASPISERIVSDWSPFLPLIHQTIR